MNKYVRNLLGIVFQSQPTQQAARIDSQSSPRSSGEWRKLWQAKGFSWRTEPEISANRQRELSKCRAIIPDVEKGIYPFKGLKLSRADVEWLLATHENGRGPVDWSDEHQRKREGLDVRGADLSYIDLSNLPLARLRGGLTEIEWNPLSDEPRKRTGCSLEKADLRGSHLEGAFLRRANLREASLSDAYLQEADLESTHLESARLRRANLEGASLRWAYLEHSHLRKTILKNADFRSTHLEDAYLSEIVLWDDKHIGPQLADVHWEGANLSVIEWSKLRQLGDEHKARKKHDEQGVLKSKMQVLGEYETAVRANRQLAIALQNQGLNEDASLFAYRAQILQRKVLWKQRHFGKWAFSWLLALVAGYGYRMERILAAYLIIVSVCAVAYFAVGMYYTPHLSMLQAFLESITAFHGRVFYELFTPDTPQIWVTAFEAIAGLIIEGVFIAMLTQRFFGK